MDLSLTTETFQQDNQTWLGSERGTSSARSVTLDLSTFTAGTHYPNGYLPSGVALAKITASGEFGLYNSAGEDGSEDFVGFLLTPVKVRSSSATVAGAVIDHGRVVEANLPFAVNAAAKTNQSFTWV